MSLFPPPPTVNTIYIIAASDSYVYGKNWTGTNIAFVTLLSVLTLVTFTCLFADCYYQPQGRYEDMERRRRRPTSSDIV